MYFDIKRMSEKCRHCRQTGIIQRWQGFQRLQGIFFCRQKCRQNIYKIYTERDYPVLARLWASTFWKPVCIQNALRMGDKDNILYTDLWIWTSETLLLFTYCAISTKTILYPSCMDLEWINKNFDLLTLFFVQYFEFGKRLTNRKIADTIIPENKILLCFPHRKFRQTEITSIFNFQIYECW